MTPRACFQPNPGDRPSPSESARAERSTTMIPAISTAVRSPCVVVGPLLAGGLSAGGVGPCSPYSGSFPPGPGKNGCHALSFCARISSIEGCSAMALLIAALVAR